MYTSNCELAFIVVNARNHSILFHFHFFSCNLDLDLRWAITLVPALPISRIWFLHLHPVDVIQDFLHIVIVSENKCRSWINNSVGFMTIQFHFSLPITVWAVHINPSYFTIQSFLVDFPHIQIWISVLPDKKLIYVVVKDFLLFGSSDKGVILRNTKTSNARERKSKDAS